MKNTNSAAARRKPIQKLSRPELERRRQRDLALLERAWRRLTQAARP